MFFQCMASGLALIPAHTDLGIGNDRRPQKERPLFCLSGIGNASVSVLGNLYEFVASGLGMVCDDPALLFTRKLF